MGLKRKVLTWEKQCRTFNSGFIRYKDNSPVAIARRRMEDEERLVLRMLLKEFPDLMR